MQVFLGDRKLSMLSVSEMIDVLDFDFDMEDGEKVYLPLNNKLCNVELLHPRLIFIYGVLLQWQ